MTGPVTPKATAAMAYRMSRREEELLARRKESVELLAGDAPKAIPEPDERPTARAQWDEANGRWVEWDEDAGGWKVVGLVSSPTELPPVPVEPIWSPMDDAGALDDIE